MSIPVARHLDDGKPPVLVTTFSSGISPGSIPCGSQPIRAEMVKLRLRAFAPQAFADGRDLRRGLPHDVEPVALADGATERRLGTSADPEKSRSSA